VPGEMVDDAVDVWHETAHRIPLDDQMRAILAAVLPAHEAMVRQRVAEEIENRHLPLMSFPDPEYVRGLMDAARIARGEQP
jgi:hypothetical protein